MNGSVIVTDAEILQLIRDGDGDAFRLIVDRYEARVLTYVLRYVKLVHRAEDVTQETFFRLFGLIMRTQNFRPEKETLEALLVSIAGSAAIDDLRRERSRDEVHNKMALFPLAEPVRPDEAALAAEIEQEVRRALAKLPPTLRRAAMLYFVHGYSSTEVAQLTHSSLDAARQRIRRARELLITHLQSYRERSRS